MKPQANPPVWVKVFTYVLFVSLLATPIIIGRISRGTETAAGDFQPSVALGRYGFVLTESAKESGIDFVHQAPRLDSKLDPIMPEVASMGAAVSIVDFDRDGWDDIYVTNSGEGSKNRLYRNLGNGKFEDVAEKLGIADVNRPGAGVSMGAVWGDYDNDGYPDLLLYKWGRPELYHNDAGKGFTLVKDAGLPAWVNANSAIWFDYNRDGKLDLLLNGYYDEKLDLWHISDTHIMPESFEYARNGGRKYLFKNLGGGKFEDVTEKVGLSSRRWALAAGAADLRGTGYPDIFIANDYGVSEIFANDKGERFHEIGKATGVGAAPKSGMNVSFGDVLNQGRFAVYVSNISKEGVLIQGNNLWTPRPGTAGDTLAYDNLAHEVGVELGGWSFGAQFGDLNNDGALDLFLTNGYISLSKENPDYWYDFSKVAVGNSAIISDAKNWPPVAGRSHSGYEQKHVWINDGEGRFSDVAMAAGVTDTHDGRSVAMADFENRGALDVVVANQKGPLLLYKNRVNPANHWIELDLEGTTSNRDGVGAEVRCYWNGKEQLQQVSAGSGFCAQNAHRIHFGLGRDPKMDRILIRWPSGKEQTLKSPALDCLHKVKEP